MRELFHPEQALALVFGAGIGEIVYSHPPAETGPFSIALIVTTAAFVFLYIIAASRREEPDA